MQFKYTPSQIYNETNLVMLGNGDLKDGIKGKTVSRENDDRMGQTISLAIGEAESGGISERKMSEEELFQLVLKAAEEAARLEEESPERDENQSNGSRTFTGFYGRISARTSLLSL